MTEDCCCPVDPEECYRRTVARMEEADDTDGLFILRYVWNSRRKQHLPLHVIDKATRAKIEGKS